MSEITPQEREILRQASAILGRCKSEKKAAASRATLDKYRPVHGPCKCNGSHSHPSGHHAACPVARAWRYQQSKRQSSPA